MAGRGPQTFKKRQKEQQRKEKQQEKIAKRLERKRQGPSPDEGVDEAEQHSETGDFQLPEIESSTSRELSDVSDAQLRSTGGD